MRAILFIISSLSLLALTACQQPATFAPKVSDDERRAEEEHQRRLVEEAGKTGGVARPWRNRPNMQKQFEKVAERIEPVAAKLCQEMGLPKLGRRCYFYFDTSRDLDINAFANGKTIVLTRGMLRFLESDDEMAAVMGHEIAHNLMGHIEAHKENAMTGLLIGAMLDGVAASQGVYGSNDWQKTGMAIGAGSYSQSFEAEADYIGLYIAARAGYDIKKTPFLWRRWAVEEPEGVYNATTHPSFPERFVALQKTIDEINYKRQQRLPLLPDMQGKVIEGDYKAE